MTGATGFVGKVLLHKLLHSVGHDLGQIYVLVRGKRGKSAQLRRDEIFSAEIFAPTENSLREKVVLIEGDVLKPDLGISPEDERKLTERVDVIFHSAATVKFEEEIKAAVEMNVEGTRKVLELAKKMRHLQSLTHISTAYCHCHLEQVEERVYPDKSLSLKNFDYDQMHDRPNSYCLTKAMAEQLIWEEKADLPLAIVRPSIVVAAESEPVAGWIDNLNGPTGMFAAAGSGILRAMHIDRDCVADIIPVDKVVNLLLAVAYETSLEKDGDGIPVYHCASGDVNPVTWGQVENWGIPLLREYPAEKMIWYPGGSFKSTAFETRLSWTLTNWIPAYFVDLLLTLFGLKPFLVRLNRRVRGAVDVLEYFGNRQWGFDSERAQDLFSSMTEVDRVKFDFDPSGIDWTGFFVRYVLGTRRFVLKCHPDSLPECRKKAFYFRIAHETVQFVAYTAFFYCIFKALF